MRQPIYRKIFGAVTEAKRSDDSMIGTIYRKKYYATHGTRINLRLFPKLKRNIQSPNPSIHYHSN